MVLAWKTFSPGRTTCLPSNCKIYTRQFNFSIVSNICAHILQQLRSYLLWVLKTVHYHCPYFCLTTDKQNLLCYVLVIFYKFMIPYKDHAFVFWQNFWMLSSYFLFLNSVFFLLMFPLSLALFIYQRTLAE